MNPLAFVVEDTEDIALVFSTALQSVGYQVQTYENGQHAIDAMTQVAPALVVLDLHLPGASGEEVLSFIRSQPGLESIPVIVTTADANWGAKLEDQATLTLLKPASFTQMKDLAQRFFHA